MWTLECYSLIKNTCDCSCQSMGFCPICQRWHGDIPIDTKMTRWLFFKLLCKNLKWKLFHKRKFERSIKEALNSEEGKKLINDLSNSIKEKKRKKNEQKRNT